MSTDHMIRDLVALLVSVPVLWLWQNVQHELAHLVVGWVVEGRRPTGLWPYPHRYEGRWYWARYDSGPATKPGRASWRHIAPRELAVILCVVSASLAGLAVGFGLHLPGVDAHLGVPLLVWCAANFVDFNVWDLGLVTRHPWTDAMRYLEARREEMRL